MFKPFDNLKIAGVEELINDSFRFFDALTLAQRVHTGQFDQGLQPYIWHPLRVGTFFLPNIDLSVLGLLHDVIEDADPLKGGGATLQSKILDALNDRADLYNDLLTLTRHKGEAYEDYIKRVRNGSVRARLVKIADLNDNLRPDRLDTVRLIRGAKKEHELRDRYTQALKMLADI